MLAGKSALVIKEAKVNEDGPLYVKIKGRKSGLIAWFLALIGIDTTTTFEVYENRVEFTEGSLSGRIKEMIPLSSISNLGTGYMKPVIWMVLAIISLLLIIPTLGISILFMLLFGFLYFFRKSMLLYAIPNSGSGVFIIFKRSLIENENITEEDAYRIIALVTRLVEKSRTK
jgi:hypothetical protein